MKVQYRNWSMDSKMSLKEISPEPVIIEMLDVFLSIRNRICKKPILTTSWSNRDTFEICDNDREERMFRRQPGSLTDATMTRIE